MSRLTLYAPPRQPLAPRVPADRSARGVVSQPDGAQDEPARVVAVIDFRIDPEEVSDDA